LDNEQERYAKVFFRHVLEKEMSSPPPPWEEIAVFVIHGLLTVGYASDSDLLFVISAFANWVFDCTEGARIAWDEEDPIFDQIHLEATGIGPLHDKRIRMASTLYGGGLVTQTVDGWSLQKFSSWPDDTIILLPHIYRGFFPIEVATKLRADSEVLAYGFSETGKSFIIAADNHLHIYARE
jgi:hypothetical protein